MNYTKKKSKENGYFSDTKATGIDDTVSENLC